MSRHPSESDLALYAGSDLGLMASLRMRLHVAGCASCRASIAAYQAAREQLAALPEPLTGDAWAVLAAEMEANINLGLAASECIQPAVEQVVDNSNWRPVFACAAALVFVVGMVWWNRPPSGEAVQSAVVMSAGPDSVELQQGGHALGLLHPGAESVTYSVRADGEVGARYVDDDTGYVVIQNVVASE